MKIENESQAEEALAALREFYREPVQRVSKYCSSLQDWANAVDARTARLKAEIYPGLDSRTNSRETVEATFAQYVADREKGSTDRRVGLLKAYQHMSDAISYTFLQIRKSSLLYRVIYCGEGTRAEMCPEHKGVWSGIEGERVCPHGCQFTGWLPVKKDPLP